MRNMVKLSLLMGFLCAFNFAVVASDDLSVDELTVEEQIVLDDGKAFTEMIKEFRKSVDAIDVKIRTCRSNAHNIWCIPGTSRYKRTHGRWNELEKSKETVIGEKLDSGEVPNGCNSLKREIGSWLARSSYRKADQDRLSAATERCVNNVLNKKGKSSESAR